MLRPHIVAHVCDVDSAHCLSVRYEQPHVVEESSIAEDGAVLLDPLHVRLNCLLLRNFAHAAKHGVRLRAQHLAQGVHPKLEISAHPPCYYRSQSARHKRDPVHRSCPAFPPLLSQRLSSRCRWDLGRDTVRTISPTSCFHRTAKITAGGARAVLHARCLLEYARVRSVPVLMPQPDARRSPVACLLSSPPAKQQCPCHGARETHSAGDAAFPAPAA
mmetsp:Transcript_9641/g.29255  ORF Transcript_9641/g.29255 Transcript_9641/m.29255 type:complete len:217 (+) Transcript_9641:1349-1999(+)